MIRFFGTGLKWYFMNQLLLGRLFLISRTCTCVSKLSDKLGNKFEERDNSSQAVVLSIPSVVSDC